MSTAVKSLEELNIPPHLEDLAWQTAEGLLLGETCYLFSDEQFKVVVDYVDSKSTPTPFLAFYNEGEYTLIPLTTYVIDEEGEIIFKGHYYLGKRVIKKSAKENPNKHLTLVLQEEGDEEDALCWYPITTDFFLD